MSDDINRLVKKARSHAEFALDLPYPRGIAMHGDLHALADAVETLQSQLNSSRDLVDDLADVGTERGVKLDEARARVAELEAERDGLVSIVAKYADLGHHTAKTHMAGRALLDETETPHPMGGYRVLDGSEGGED